MRRRRGFSDPADNYTSNEMRSPQKVRLFAMLIDARTVPACAEFTCDLCVVGAGPAGIAIVNRLRDSGLAIVPLESGGFHPELATQNCFAVRLAGGNITGWMLADSGCSGGSTNRWGGWCRPLEPVDFTRRDWIPRSGWPIDADALEPYTADVAKLFELSDPRFDLRVVARSAAGSLRRSMGPISKHRLSV